MKKGVTRGKRLNHEPPTVTAKLGWRYHHIGIPHTQPRAQEHHVAHLGVHVAGFETNPYTGSKCWIEMVAATLSSLDELLSAFLELERVVRGISPAAA